FTRVNVHVTARYVTSARRGAFPCLNARLPLCLAGPWEALFAEPRASVCTSHRPDRSGRDHVPIRTLFLKREYGGVSSFEPNATTVPAPEGRRRVAPYPGDGRGFGSRGHGHRTSGGRCGQLPGGAGRGRRERARLDALPERAARSRLLGRGLGVEPWSQRGQPQRRAARLGAHPS